MQFNRNRNTKVYVYTSVNVMFINLFETLVQAGIGLLIVLDGVLYALLLTWTMQMLHVILLDRHPSESS